MDAPSVAHSGADSRPDYTARAERALRLFEEHGQEIRRIAAGVYRVPSCAGSGSYDVLYGGSREECPCPDFQFGHGRACQHLLAVGAMHAAKRSGIKVRTISVAGDPFKAAAKRRGCSLCFGGYITMTAEEDGQERDAAVPCKRCTRERR